MAVNSIAKDIVKPSQLVKKGFKLFGFINQEDILYKIARGHFKYMNYGMIPSEGGAAFDEYLNEEINYLELIETAKPLLVQNPDVLEIGCGFGYGSQLIYKEIKPKTLLSLDRADNAIRFAKENFKDTNVVYEQHDFSTDNPLQKNFDLIYTVESGGVFPVSKSFHEAFQMLRTNGFFLVANINTKEGLQKKREYAEKAGFELYQEKDVTPQVISYLESDQAIQRVNLALESMPFYKSAFLKLFMKLFKEFFRLPGSKSFELLGNKEFYYHFCFKKVSEN